MSSVDLTGRESISRREFLAGSGALVVLFSLPATARAQTTTPPDKLSRYSGLDAWLAVREDGRITVFCGKVELGTGVSTSLAQIVAEELDVPIERVTMIQGDTARTPDQGYTVGSKTIQQGGPQLRQAAAEARQTLLGLGAAKLGVPVDELVVRDGVISARGGTSVSYAVLIGGRRFEQPMTGKAKPKSQSRYTIVGQPVKRVDIPGKVTGTHTYVHDVRLPGMLHGRVVRPSVPGATLIGVDEASVSRISGVVKVVSRGNFVGVVAEREEQAIRAARELKVTWREPAARDAAEPATSDRDLTKIGNVETALETATKKLEATYRTPFQMHASIGPSCGIADVKSDGATIWSGTQGSFGLRDAVANLLGLSADRVRVIWTEASGCYGHNGADDAAADAALLSQAAGQPVRVQWMRHDEHGWEPKGPAMTIDVRGGLDAEGRIVAWDYAVTTPTHSTRPRSEPGNLLAGALTGHPVKSVPTGGDRNAKHTYVIPNDRVTVRWQATSLLRPSALRGLGAPQNTLANESFMDELAAAAGADPVEFRLRHLTDSRAREVIEAVARLAAWQPRVARSSARGAIVKGRGVAYAQYETATAYVATVADVVVNRQTGEVRVTRVFVAHDCGLVINPDGVRNQIEGNVIQTISRTLKEEVKTDGAKVTSLDWTSYPILTFAEVPEAIDIVLLDRPDRMAVGAGEPAACPIPAAIGNAVFDAIGVRLRTMPFTPARVRSALAELGTRRSG